MSHVLLLDTNIWSHLLLSGEVKRTSVHIGLLALLKKYPGAARATSAICVAECLVAARRIADAAQRLAAERAFQAEFTNPELIIVEVSQSLLNTAASLRAQALRRAASAGGAPASADGGRLKLPDAVIAASCLDFDPPAILVTENDQDFRYPDDGQTRTVADLVVERIA